MAKDSDLSDVDPLDFRSALVAFLEGVRAIAKAWRPEVESRPLAAEYYAMASVEDVARAEWRVWCDVERSARRAVAAGYTLCEFAPQSFPVRDFTVGLLESVRRVESAVTLLRFGFENNLHVITRGREEQRELQKKLGDAWRQVRVHYCAMQDFLREVEVRAGVGQMSRGEWKLEPLEEPAARAPTEVAPDVQTTDKTLTHSELEAGREWTLVIRAMKEEALADEREFDEKDVLDEAAYQYLVGLLKDQGKTPSQTFETWRKYVGKFRRFAGNPKRPRRLS
jgi:hypothetical protein